MFAVAMISALVFWPSLLAAISAIHKDRSWALPGSLAAISFTGLVFVWGSLQ